MKKTILVLWFSTGILISSATIVINADGSTAIQIVSGNITQQINPNGTIQTVINHGAVQTALDNHGAVSTTVNTGNNTSSTFYSNGIRQPQ